MPETNPCHPAEQQARQDRLEAAYLESGRTCSTYTGLMTTPEEPAPVPEATTDKEAALSAAEAEKGALLLRDVDDGIDVANEAAATINARLAGLGLQLTEPAVEALWRAVGVLDVVEVEGQANA